MPRIAQVEGRLDDILYIPDRGYVGRLDPVFKGLSNIIETQIIQEDLHTITLLMVTDQVYKDSTEEDLMSNLRSKLGNTINISIRYVDQVPRGPNGKFRSVISKVSHLYPDHF
jgi:phenylacetate-CoA ligase